MILEEGMKFTATTIPQKDAQFLESRQFNISDIARWYGVPPHKLMDLQHATFSNIEHQAIQAVNDALMPWIVALELESRIKLFAPRNRRRLQTKINVNGLLRGDLQSRSTYYKEMSNLGVYSVNEIRALEDENGIGADGDKRLVQLNQTTLKKIGEEPPALEPVVPRNLPDDDQVDEIADKIFNREHHRLTEALSNYKGDPDKFNRWLSTFAMEHSDYISGKLSDLFDCRAYTFDHIKAMRNEFKQIRDGDTNSQYSAAEIAGNIKKAML
jgi:hypothetical protein